MDAMSHSRSLVETHLADCRLAVSRFDQSAKIDENITTLRPVFQSLAEGRFLRRSASEGDFAELGLALASIFEKPVRKIVPYPASRQLRAQNGELLTDAFEDEALWKTKMYRVYEKHELWLWPLISSYDCLGCGYDRLRELFTQEMAEAVRTQRAQTLIRETADAIVWSLDFYLAFALAQNKRCLGYFARLIRLFPRVVPVHESYNGSGEWYVIVR